MFVSIYTSILYDVKTQYLREQCSSCDSNISVKSMKLRVKLLYEQGRLAFSLWLVGGENSALKYVQSVQKYNLAMLLGLLEGAKYMTSAP